jgi:hypothetical protein
MLLGILLVFNDRIGGLRQDRNSKFAGGRSDTFTWPGYITHHHIRVASRLNVHIGANFHAGATHPIA